MNKLIYTNQMILIHLQRMTLSFGYIRKFLQYHLKSFHLRMLFEDDKVISIEQKEVFTFANKSNIFPTWICHQEKS